MSAASDPLVEVISTAIIENPTPTSYDEADRLAEIIAESVRSMLAGGCDGDLPGPELTDEQRTHMRDRLTAPDAPRLHVDPDDLIYFDGSER